jgi:hypothetical protein
LTALLLAACAADVTEEDIAGSSMPLERGIPTAAAPPAPGEEPPTVPGPVPGPDYGARSIPAGVEARPPTPAEWLAPFAVVGVPIVVTATAVRVDRSADDGPATATFTLDEVIRGASPPPSFTVDTNTPNDQICGCQRFNPAPGYRYLLLLRSIDGAAGRYRVADVPLYAPGNAWLSDDGWVQFNGASRMTMDDVRGFFGTSGGVR